MRKRERESGRRRDRGTLEVVTPEDESLAKSQIDFQRWQVWIPK